VKTPLGRRRDLFFDYSLAVGEYAVNVAGSIGSKPVVIGAWEHLFDEDEIWFPLVTA
jgi:hypothetical protein